MSGSWISVAEAARIVDKSPETVRRAVRRGAVGYKRAGVRGWLSVKAADVQALMVVKSRTDCADAAGDAAGSEGLAKTG